MPESSPAVVRPIPRGPEGRPEGLTRRALYWAFFRVSISGFGGVMPWIRRMLVEQRGWLSDVEFLETLSICQILPGPNVLNISVQVGTRFYGLVGALAAAGGLMSPPLVMVMLLSAFYDRFGGSGLVRGALTGMAAAGAGLVLAMGIRLALALPRRVEAILLGAATFVAVGVLRWPILTVVLTMMPLGLALAVWRRRAGPPAGSRP